VYLLKHHNCRIKQGYKISTSVRFFGAYEKLSHSSTAVFRGIECGIVVLVMFEFKLKKMSHHAITCGLGSASDGTRTIRKLSLNCLKTKDTSLVRMHNKQCSQKCKSNILHTYLFCATKHYTGHTIKGGRSRDVHS